MNRFVFLTIPFLLPSLTGAGDVPKTCPNEMQAYHQCILAHPADCYPTCTEADVILNPGLLASMRSPNRACESMKIMSCGYQDYCCKNREGVKTACITEEQSYWRCIEEQAGCGVIDCGMVLNSTNTASTPIGDAAVSTQVDPPQTTTVVLAPTNITVKGTKQPRTCPGTLKAYQQCVLSHPYDCYPTCTNVDVILNPRLLASMRSPTRACTAMKIMSCAYQESCCKNRAGVVTACIKEKRAYWRCIETQAGCGVINCSKVRSTLPRISTVSTPMADMMEEKTSLRKKSSTFPLLDEECKGELQTMQECQAARNCSDDCGDPLTEDKSFDPALHLCWMQGCCERCETEQTSYRQCVERKSECSLDCMMDLDETERIEDYEVAGDSAAPPCSLHKFRVASVLLFASVLFQ